MSRHGHQPQIPSQQAPYWSLALPYWASGRVTSQLGWTLRRRRRGRRSGEVQAEQRADPAAAADRANDRPR